MEFVKYQHVERYGTTETEGITIGTCYIFPKIDGTNSSVWLQDNRVCAGSRNRELSLDKDNAGFLEYINQKSNIQEFFKEYPNLRLYGEWLVPHSLKTYRDNAWNKFYIFDVTYIEDGITHYMPYNEYQPILEKYSIDYIPPIAIINNPSADQLYYLLDKNDFLIKDGEGAGEGIVIKNYNYTNKFRHIIWAKIVRSEFKEKHTKVMGAPITDNKLIEDKIVAKYVTSAFIEKTYSNIVEKHEGWSSKYIPELLNTVYHDLVTEESWHIIKDFKNPTIHYDILFRVITNKIKDIKRDLF